MKTMKVLIKFITVVTLFILFYYSDLDGVSENNAYLICLCYFISSFYSIVSLFCSLITKKD